jgi:hypothetical protein
MGTKLNEFRLETYDERSVLCTALQLYRNRYLGDKATVHALLIRLSRTECQPGGCEYCNEDRRREADEWRDERD